MKFLVPRTKVQGSRLITREKSQIPNAKSQGNRIRLASAASAAIGNSTFPVAASACPSTGSTSAAPAGARSHAEATRSRSQPHRAPLAGARSYTRTSFLASAAKPRFAFWAPVKASPASGASGWRSRNRRLD